MKISKIFAIVFSLVISVVIGNLVASIADTQLMISGVDILPFGISSVLFAGSFIPLSPAGSLNAYVAVNVEKPGQNTGRGGDVRDEIVFFDMDDVADNGMPARDESGILMVAGDITFNPGAYMITVYSTPGTIVNTSKSQGDPDAKGFIQGCKFSHPGNEQAIREFRTNWLNRNVGIIHRKCSDATKMDIYGTKCAPLQLQVTWEQNKDKNFNEFTFESLGSGPDVGIYQGTLSFDEGSGSGS